MSERLEQVKNAPVVQSAVVVLYDAGGKVLLLKRRDTDRAFGGWCLPGGACKNGEFLSKTAVREAREEAPGLDISELYMGDPLAHFTSWSERSKRWYRIAVFTHFTPSIKAVHGDEHVAAVLVRPDYALQHMELPNATRAALYAANIGRRDDTPTWPIAGQAPMLPDAPGLFGARRRSDIHVGVDLYCEKGAPIVAMMGGIVISVEAFTGPNAEDPSPWWNDTQAVLVRSGGQVITYGEIESAVKVGDFIPRGGLVGIATSVLKKNKGRPMVMLHLEMMTENPTGITKTLWWKYQDEACTTPEPMPPQLLDPTGLLYEAAGMHGMKHFSMESYDGRSFIDPDAPRVE